MRFSEDRLSHIANLIFRTLAKDHLVAYSQENIALQAIKEAVNKFFKIEDDLDTLVTQKIRSQKKAIVEGSPEWEILYQKYFSEEWQKLGR